MSYPTHTAVQASGDKSPTAKDLQGASLQRRQQSALTGRHLGSLRTWELHDSQRVNLYSLEIMVDHCGRSFFQENWESFAQSDTRWQGGTPTECKGLRNLATTKAHQRPTGALFQD